MSEDTQNHQYNTPKQGTLDWDILLNENFNRLDQDVEIRDTRSSLSDYEPKADAKFLSTDTGEVFIGDGSKWSRLPLPSNENQFGSEPGNISPATRPFTTNGEVRVTVGPNDSDDYRTIQEAVYDVPLFLRHAYRIYVRPEGGPYGDVVVPCVITGDQSDNQNSSNLGIVGDKSVSEKPQVGSFMVINPTGRSAVWLSRFEVLNSTPYEDNPGRIFCFGGDYLYCSYIDFRQSTDDIDIGFTVYGGHLRTDHIDVGDRNLDYAYWGKTHATVDIEPPCTGKVREEVCQTYDATSMFIADGTTISGVDGVANTRDGFVLDSNDGTLYGVERLGGQ